MLIMKTSLDQIFMFHLVTRASFYQSSHQKEKEGQETRGTA